MVQLFENCKDQQFDHALILSLGKAEIVHRQGSSFLPEHHLQSDQRLCISQVVYGNNQLVDDCESLRVSGLLRLYVLLSRLSSKSLAYVGF
jgi:hypothetical protein